MTLQSGDIFSGSNATYLVGNLLGGGGFGNAFEVIDQNTGNEFVAKSPTDNNVTKFKSIEGENRVLQDLETLQVPNIVKVIELTYFEVGRDKYPILVLEKAEGQTIKDATSNGGLGYAESSDIVSKLATTLKMIHKAGYMHLDIAPDNIFIDDIGGKNNVTIIDFGISAQKSDTSTFAITSQKHSMHKPFFGAPEQMQGNPSQGSDIFSIGATGFSILLGYHETLKIAQGNPTPPYDLTTYIPPNTVTDEQTHFHNVIKKATWAERSGRFATVEDMENAILGKEPEENFPRLIVDGNTHILTGDGPWTIGREDVFDSNNNPDIIIQDKSPHAPYISRLHAKIERRSQDGTLMLHATGLNETRIKISKNSSVRWNPIRKDGPGYPLGSRHQVICFGYADHPSSKAIDKNGNPVAPGPYQQLEFWPPNHNITG